MNETAFITLLFVFLSSKPRQTQPRDVLGREHCAEPE